MRSYTHAEGGRTREDTESGSRCHTQEEGIEHAGLATIQSGSRAEGAQKGTREELTRHNRRAEAKAMREMGARMGETLIQY